MSDDSGPALTLAVLRQLYADYTKLRKNGTDADWPELVLVAVTPTLTGDHTPDVAQQRVAETSGKPDVQGWIRCRSWSGYLGFGATLSDAAGPPIAGEWVQCGNDSNPGTSVHLRPDGSGKVTEWHYSERLLQDGDALGAGEIAALRQRVTVAARPPCEGGNVLVYHVFWGTADGENRHAVRRLFARFAGFAEENIVIAPGRARPDNTAVVHGG